MRDCPDCGDPLAVNPTRCTACGYRPGKKAGAATENPDVMRCEWVAGDRCHYAGSISPSTTGGGPWYCTRHFGCDDPAIGAKIVADSERDVATRQWTGPVLKEAARRAFLTRTNRGE